MPARSIGRTRNDEDSCHFVAGEFSCAHTCAHSIDSRTRIARAAVTGIESGFCFHNNRSSLRGAFSDVIPRDQAHTHRERERERERVVNRLDGFTFLCFFAAFPSDTRVSQAAVSCVRHASALSKLTASNLRLVVSLLRPAAAAASRACRVAIGTRDSSATR